MEALVGIAAFGLACNVMQTIQFSIQAVSMCKAMYAGRSPDRELVGHCNKLKDAVKKLEDPSAAQADPELQAIARNLIGKAEQLDSELTKIANDSGSKVRAVRNTVSYAFSGKRKIRGLEKSIKASQEVMETRILIDLRSQLDRMSQHTRKQLNAVDQRLRTFVAQLELGHYKLDQLIAETGEVKKLIQAEAATTRTHITQQLEHSRTLQISKSRVDTFINSLTYPEMNARRSAIREAGRNSYRWIFKDSRDDDDDDSENDEERKWDSFADWLRSGDSIYWISGKAGSGKSSLIRYLCASAQTRRLLQEWKSNAIILSAFLWNSGTPSQRSQKHIFAALLHQFLLSRDEEVVRLLRENPDLNKSTIDDWSKEEVLTAFEAALKIVNIPVCIFVDGLDEVDRDSHDGETGLLNAIDRMRAVTNVKLCLGSREEAVFQSSLYKYPKLRLQDLNEADIWEYVRRTIGACPSGHLEAVNDSIWLDNLAWKIVRKADGVFLWVHLVTKWICEGLYGFDDAELLHARLEGLHPGLEGLYTSMWSRLNSIDKDQYLTTSSLCFQMVIQFRNLKFIELLFCIDTNLRKALLAGGKDVIEQTILNAAIVFRRQLLVRCAGLLETAWPGEAHDTKLEDVLQYGVSFIHRSARDFLTSTIDGKDILGHFETTEVELNCYYTLSLLATSLVEKSDNPYAGSLRYIKWILQTHKGLHWLDSDVLKKSMLELFDTTMKRRQLLEKDTMKLALGICPASITGVERLIQDFPGQADTWRSRALFLALSYVRETQENCFVNISNDISSLGRVQPYLELIHKLVAGGAEVKDMTVSCDFSWWFMSCTTSTTFIDFLFLLKDFLDYSIDLNHNRVERIPSEEDLARHRDAYVTILMDFFKRGADLSSTTILRIRDPKNNRNSDAPWSFDFGNDGLYRSLILAEMEAREILHGFKDELANWIEDWHGDPRDKQRLLNSLRTPPRRLPRAQYAVIRYADGPIHCIHIDEDRSSRLQHKEFNFSVFVHEMYSYAHGLHTGGKMVDYQEMVDSLVQQKYMQEGAMATQNPLGLNPANDIERFSPHVPLSEMSWEYQGEYDQLMRAMKEGFGKESHVDASGRVNAFRRVT
ncbi:hypothetical protein BU24DRAFT_494528 [Aaosphaeria arxii CBS 175.79]|uniref:Uncharacterized protein n=1 Tax=Aaosphaeria arxii CBS 175.79 TaxID=1450172 RepID=A0A6A5XHF4_9PLEO|nr:uncharacterized protein BU24DRAFT_494528 [Aaosphaeria arxii CBS 175.79]KAF2012542.1 hypothetical protein BU24DRAFT_494528 [Aaosphaeria arxii CBS 175.79]